MNEETHPNDLKRDEYIVVIESKNGYQHLNGRVLKITGIGGDTGTAGVYYTVTNIERAPATTATIYAGFSGKYDTFRKADRIDRAIELRKELTNREKGIGELREEIEFLGKYKSEEEYVASKIDQLLKTEGIEKKAEILRLMKRSNYI